MWTSSVPVFLFGMLPYCLRWYSKIFYITLWTLNGLLQSVGWPTEVCIMGNWFGYKSRGVIMGLWSACASVGNIMGTIVSSLTLQMGYQYAFAMNSLLLIVGGIITKCFLLSAPRNIGLPDPLESPEDSDRLEEVLNERPKPISFWSACCLPGVPCYSFAYACLKLVNYSFFFWLPFYLYSRFAWDESLADNLSIWYDCGGIIAAVIAGFVSVFRHPIIFVHLSVVQLW
ncbi:hypothetical protein AB6A40_005545 [Gnathostoma spinigerum]|uniref:Major facilitator superfamily (MFS) profile domain-containing protein n=1 Tax=Gnathostoma spinigerum TaxID=75299 RepID=A0ABD6EN28_9BILA